MTDSPTSPIRRFVAGCGYLGRRVAELWSSENGRIFPLTRNPSRAEMFRRRGWNPLLGDLCGELPEIPEVDTALLAVGFDRNSGRTIHEVYVEGLAKLLARLPESLQRVIYISSTGVYGAADGDCVNETSPCRPDRPGGVACLEAESLLRASPFANRLIILRLAGIYGPGRLPRIDAVRDGQPIAADPDGFLNLIHVDDAARIVAAAEQSSAPALYCVSDNAPCRRRDFLSEAAKQLGLPTPEFTSTESDVPSRRQGPNKRVDSSRLYAELPVTLAFPTFREGLAHAIADVAEQEP